MKLIEAANSVLAWWEEAQYETTSNGEDEFNVFDEDDDRIFDRLKEAVKETTDES